MDEEHGGPVMLPAAGPERHTAMISVHLDMPRIALATARQLAAEVSAAHQAKSPTITVTFPACGQNPRRLIPLDRQQQRDFLRDLRDARPDAITQDELEIALGLRRATPALTRAQVAERMRAAQPAPLADGLSTPIEIAYDGTDEDFVRLVDLHAVLGRDGVPSHIRGRCHVARGSRLFRLDRVWRLTDHTMGEVLTDPDAILRWIAAQARITAPLPSAPPRQPPPDPPAAPALRGWAPGAPATAARDVLAKSLSRPVTLIIGRNHPQQYEVTITEIHGSRRGPSRICAEPPGWIGLRRFMISQVQRLTDLTTGETFEGEAAVKAWVEARIAESKGAARD
jgi:hypothetical protein